MYEIELSHDVLADLKWFKGREQNLISESFQIGERDELTDEIIETRKNSAFMEFLDQRGEHAHVAAGHALQK